MQQNELRIFRPVPCEVSNGDGVKEVEVRRMAVRNETTCIQDVDNLQHRSWESNLSTQLMARTLSPYSTSENGTYSELPVEQGSMHYYF